MNLSGFGVVGQAGPDTSELRKELSQVKADLAALKRKYDLARDDAVKLHKTIAAVDDQLVQKSREIIDLRVERDLALRGRTKPQQSFAARSPFATDTTPARTPSSEDALPRLSPNQATALEGVKAAILDDPNALDRWVPFPGIAHQLTLLGLPMNPSTLRKHLDAIITKGWLEKKVIKTAGGKALGTFYGLVAEGALSAPSNPPSTDAPDRYVPN